MKQWNSNAFLLVICLLISCAHYAYRNKFKKNKNFNKNLIKKFRKNHKK